jgi:general secretion pathway protein G
MRVVGLSLLICIAALIGALSASEQYPGHYGVMLARHSVRYLPGYIENYRQDHGKLPPAESAFEVLAGEYIREVPVDPWGHPYAYRATEEPPGYRIYSVGFDGVDESGAGDDVIADWKYYQCEPYGVNCPRHFVSLGLLVVSGLSVLIAAAWSVRLVAIKVRKLAASRRDSWRAS